MKREVLLEKGYSEEQVTDLLNMFHEQNQKNNDLQNEVNKLKGYETKFNEIQTQMDEINKSKMTEQEKIDAAKKEADDYLNKSRIIYNTAKAKEILAGYDVSDELIQNLVNGDETSTINSANQLKSLLDDKIEKTAIKIKDEISNKDVKPTPSNIPQQDDTMTIEKFGKLSMTEQKQWKDAHLDEYHEMYSNK